MENKVSLDYIIVGQGLAGSAIAMQLLLRGKKIMVLDEPLKNHSSAVAAGLFNPITGRNWVKTWMADSLFPSLHQYYKEVEKLVHKNFFFPLPLYRPFASVQDQNEWMGRSTDPNYGGYISNICTTPQFGKTIKDPFGGLMLKQCGYLDTLVYLGAVKGYIKTRGLFRENHFNEDLIMVYPDRVEYGEYTAAKIIFCEGIHNESNRWFRNLPVQKLKGETITIKTNWEKDVILNRGVYMVPGNVSGEFKVGSTYRFTDTSPGISAQGRQELEEKLKELFQPGYEVLSQDWGIRPVTTDRKPLLGRHPESERLVIFNGLGTKGVSLAPYFSEILFQSLENSKPIDKAVAVTRYY